jgi:tetratricopeptide (TPR) repeat protein
MMNEKKIQLSIFLIICLGVGLSGCVNSMPGTADGYQPTPVKEAIDLHNTGFDAYVSGNYSVALEYYNRSIAADPNYTRAWVDKGNVLMRLDLPYEAVLAYDGALAQDNSQAVVWNSRGEALMATGNYSEAHDSFEQALRLAPKFVEAQENLKNASEKIK